MRETNFFCTQNLQKNLGNFQIGPVSFGCGQGDYVALLGPTGCGKTSFIRCLSGIAGKISGGISLDGKAIENLPAFKRKIGLVSQTSDLFPHLSVEENVLFGMRYSGKPHSETQKLLEKYLSLFGLNNLRKRSVTTLSGGESKRTAMARSLITEPKILLLDEPLGMLDHNGRKETLETLKMVHRELGATIIHVTHDRHEAWGIAENCAVMHKGKILESGPVAGLFRRPKTRFCAEFLGGTNIFPASFSGNKADLGWMELILDSQPEFSKGYVLIRPEWIRVERDNKPGIITGTVKAAWDFGEYLELEVLVRNSARLLIHTSFDNPGRIFPGSEIALSWDESAPHALGDEL